MCVYMYLSAVCCCCGCQFNSTPMHCAALTGHVDVLAMLAARGGDAHKRTTDGVSPLDSARMEGHLAVVAYLTGTFSKVTWQLPAVWCPLVCFTPLHTSPPPPASITRSAESPDDETD